LLVLHRALAHFDAGFDDDPSDLEGLPARLLAAGDATHAAEAAMALSRMWWSRGEGTKSAEHREEALELVHNVGPSPTKAYVLTEGARQLMLAYEWGRTREVGGEAVALAEELGLDRFRASVLITIGTAGGEMEELEQGIEIAQRVKDIEQLTRGYNNLAELVLETGEIAAAGPLYEAARSVAARFGHTLALRWLDAQEGVYFYVTGDWDRSGDLLDAYVAEVEGGLSSLHGVFGENRARAASTCAWRHGGRL
jgi:tetratricopeptide (TPR) repeat protein